MGFCDSQRGEKEGCGFWGRGELLGEWDGNAGRSREGEGDGSGEEWVENEQWLGLDDVGGGV